MRRRSDSQECRYQEGIKLAGDWSAVAEEKKEEYGRGGRIM